jgi:hypothetical protein
MIDRNSLRFLCDISINESTFFGVFRHRYDVAHLIIWLGFEVKISPHPHITVDFELKIFRITQCRSESVTIAFITHLMIEMIAIIAYFMIEIDQFSLSIFEAIRGKRFRQRVAVLVISHTSYFIQNTYREVPRSILTVRTIF